MLQEAWEMEVPRKGNEHLGRKEGKSRKSHRSSFMETFERLDHKSDKKDEGERIQCGLLRNWS